LPEPEPDPIWEPEDGLEALLDEELGDLDEPETIGDEPVAEDEGEPEAIDDALEEEIMPELSDDDLLPDDTEISLDEDLFNDEVPEFDDSLLVDGELEPDEVLSVEGLGAEEFPLEESSLPDDLEEFSEVSEAPAPETAETAGSGASPDQAAGAGQAADGPAGSAEQAEQAGQESGETAPPEAPNPERQAMANLFGYLGELAGELPAETAHKAEELRLKERLDGIQQAILGKRTEALPIRTGRDRRKSQDRRGPGERRHSDVPAAAAPEDENVFVDTFSMIGKMSRLLPEDQKKELSEKVKRILTTLEKYRK
jgi:hypothetical protein